jgi:hypothetical protein
MYEQQTELPNEVVISLSEAKKVSTHIVDVLQKELWAFPVTFLVSDAKLYAGENRNRACQHAIGDIFICQDADDLPHPQRIEIIKYFFKTYELDHLMHEMSQLKQHQSFSCSYYENFSTIPFCYFDTFTDECYGNFTNGNVAIARHVFETIQWPGAIKAQDVMFNKKVYQTFNRCMGVKVPLYFCFPSLSSWKYAKNKYEGSNQIACQMLALKPVDIRIKKHTLTMIYDEK